MFQYSQKILLSLLDLHFLHQQRNIVKHYFALAILTAATAAMAASPEVPTTFSTKEEALKEAGLDIYESAKNAEIINDAVSNIKTFLNLHIQEPGLSTTKKMRLRK